MIVPTEHVLKGKVIERLNLSPGVSDSDYAAAVKAAMAVLAGVTSNIPDYPTSADAVRTVEVARLLQNNAENARREYSSLIQFATEGTAFFQITASPFTRCEALIVQLYNPPARYTGVTP